LEREKGKWRREKEFKGGRVYRRLNTKEEYRRYEDWV